MLKKRRKRPSIKIRRPFKEFIRTQEFSGILLIICTGIALFIANTQLAHQYFELWETYLSVSLGGFILKKPLHLWINDGLMAIFFFVVGLEIKREILVGELKSLKKATLPISAALGGMIVPALIYSIININNPSAARGWGIPMATDIAFVIGIMALLGTRVPFSLKIFITSLAIVDDIGAVMIIALFYSQNIEYTYLVIAGYLLLSLFFINRFEIQNHLVYALIGCFMWYFIFLSGMHATIAGILVAVAIPARTRINPDEFIAEGQLILERFKAAGPRDKEILLNRQHLAALKTLELTCLNVQTPLQRFERSLHYWVAFAIVPLFILSNAGITIETIDLKMFFQPITLGVILGLVFGKQIGIFLFAWISVKLGLTELPSGLTWGHIYGGAWLGGIGFTMSLFIASLALIDPNNLIMAKIGIITGSLISGVVGFLILRYVHNRIYLEEFNSE
ncbi:MAG: Na+/H+ antiporter NhaA [Candidatus Heimdallarchaeota archaeon]|nr:MAG: Na+/H+ antiporter NhaA [Candidatus Heimdallarchaeota archaeon]